MRSLEKEVYVTLCDPNPPQLQPTPSATNLEDTAVFSLAKGDSGKRTAEVIACVT